MFSELRNIQGLDWQENGQAVLSGRLLHVLQRLDQRFLQWALDWGAEEFRFPAFLSARELDRLDYFRSFPHLATFPVALDGRPEKLRAFTDRPVDGDGAVRLGECAPVREVLTPAACYHFYVLFQDRCLERPADLTTVATCFRREAYYRPLQRQWNFTMREIVRLGTAEEVDEFLECFRERCRRLFLQIGLSIEWRPASDAFFDPPRNPRALAQRLDPLKTEMVFGGELAIGSLNVHRNFFGETFGINRGDQPVSSGCVAFGLERWLYALLCRFGPDDRTWPAAVLETDGT